MQLEDHLGDVIRKARNMSAVSASAAAAAAGISESELTALEASGQTAQKINFPVFAIALGLHPQKLAAVAGGWLPAEKNLGCWRELRAFTTASEGLTVNAYLAWDGASRDAALFDTGVEARPVLDCLAENRLQLRHIFITHSHWDHVEALPKFRKTFPQALLHSGSINAPAAQRNQPGEVVALGGLRIAHRETPGHAMDGVTYLIDGWPGAAATVAVVGDTLFAGSMGNGNGQWELARKKIRQHVLSLPPGTLLCPGHGPLTTVAEELEFNPFF
jgi:glyoxylase-like metal-dependent hydrolase (beta-lactamase superfamily II)